MGNFCLILNLHFPAIEAVNSLIWWGKLSQRNRKFFQSPFTHKRMCEKNQTKLIAEKFLFFNKNIILSFSGFLLYVLYASWKSMTKPHGLPLVLCTVFTAEDVIFTVLLTFSIKSRETGDFLYTRICVWVHQSIPNDIKEGVHKCERPSTDELTECSTNNSKVVLAYKVLHTLLLTC